RRRMHVTHTVAVGNLEEPIASRHRPDLHGLEEDVESWFPHRLAPSRPGQPDDCRKACAGRSFFGSTNGISAVTPVSVPCSDFTCSDWPGADSSIGAQT